MASRTSKTSKGRQPTAEERTEILRARYDGTTTDKLFARYPEVDRRAIQELVEDNAAIKAQYEADHPEPTDEQPAEQPEQPEPVPAAIPEEVALEILARRAAKVTKLEIVKEYRPTYGKKAVMEAIDAADKKLAEDKAQTEQQPERPKDELAERRTRKAKSTRTAKGKKGDEAEAKQPEQPKGEQPTERKKRRGGLMADGRPRNKVVTPEEGAAIEATVQEAIAAGQKPDWAAIADKHDRSVSCVRNVHKWHLEHAS